MTYIGEYSVYRHINKTNGKQYIGITKQKPESRWGNNGANYKDCTHFWCAIMKYGWDGFDHEILYTGLTKDAACDIEMRMIADEHTQDKRYGYNIMAGGAAPSIPDEVRKKMSVAMLGNTNGLGKPCSPEKREKISVAQRGRKLTDDHKKKLSEAKKGKSHPSPSEETRQKISNSHMKTGVYCPETDIHYASIQECARATGLYATNICKCCKGKIKTTGGMHFVYEQ